MPNGTPQPSPRPDPGPARPVKPARSRLRRPLTGLALAGVAIAAALAVIVGSGSLAGDTGLVAAASPVASTTSPGAGGPSPSASPASTDPGAVPVGTTAAPQPTAAAASATPSAPSPQPSPTPKPTPDPDPDGDGVPDRQLQAHLDRLRARLDIPGVSVAILWDDGRTWTGASGLRDVNRGKPMTADTAFALASVSKTFTAAVVLQLVDEGKLSLDQRVAPLLPDYPMHPWVTVRQLLDHTSGMPDYFLNGRIDRPLQSDPDAAWTAADAWDYVLPPRKRYRPGRVWYYSNTNYLLLGELVKAVTGRPLDEEIRARLLDPLALETAWYQGAEKPRADGTQAYRLVALPGGGVRIARVAPRSDVMPFRSVVTAAGGAGAMAATAIDAARWMRAYARGEVVSPELHRAMLADVAATARLGAEVPYGLGIQALPVGRRPALGHSGRFLGFRNVVRDLPAYGVTIAVLTNQGVKDPSRIAQRLLNLILPPLHPGPVDPGSDKPTPSPTTSP